MRLNHLNLTVPDVPRTREFFETYFGSGASPRGTSSSCWSTNPGSSSP